MRNKGKRTIKLEIAYDGTDFRGWQIQKNDRTVQGELEKALDALHKHKVSVCGAGRTDSGVHASGQVAHFITDVPSMPSERFAPALNGLLPHDVRVLSSEQVPEDFHARYSAVQRTYRYFFYPYRVAPPYIDRFCHNAGRRLDVRKLNDFSGIFIGTHDFEAFATAGEEQQSTVRTIYGSSFFPKGEFLVYQIRGNGFLRKMVRSIVGTMLEYELKGWGLQALREILNCKRREAAGTTAPAKGLFLHKVDYRR